MDESERARGGDGGDRKMVRQIVRQRKRVADTEVELQTLRL